VADSGLGLDNIALTNVPPKNISITQTSPALVEGGTFTGSIQFRDTGVKNTQSWSALINYGDGSTATVSGITSRTFTIPSHVYAETNLTGYNLQVTVTDNGGLSGIGSLLVPVADAPPTLTVTPSATTIFEHQLLTVV